MVFVLFLRVPSASPLKLLASHTFFHSKKKYAKNAAPAESFIWGVGRSYVWRTGVWVRTRHRRDKKPPLRNGIWGIIARGERWGYELCFQGGARSKNGEGF